MRKRKREHKQEDKLAVRRFQFSCPNCRAAALADLRENDLNCSVSGEFIICRGASGPLAHARLRTLTRMEGAYG